MTNSLDYSNSLEIVSEIHQSTKEFINFKKIIESSENPEKIIEEYWQNINDLLTSLSSEIGLDVNLIPDNMSQFEYHSKAENVLTEEDIINSVFLNDIQKRYIRIIYCFRR